MFIFISQHQFFTSQASLPCISCIHNNNILYFKYYQIWQYPSVYTFSLSTNNLYFQLPCCCQELVQKKSSTEIDGEVKSAIIIIFLIHGKRRRNGIHSLFSFIQFNHFVLARRVICNMFAEPSMKPTNPKHNKVPYTGLLEHNIFFLFALLQGQIESSC